MLGEVVGRGAGGKYGVEGVIGLENGQYPTPTTEDNQFGKRIIIFSSYFVAEIKLYHDLYKASVQFPSPYKAM